LGQDPRIFRKAGGFEKRQRILKCGSGFEEKWRIGPEVIKACGKGGLLPQSASLNCRGNISCEEQEQEQRTEADHSSKPLLFSHQKFFCELSVYSKS